MDWPGHLDGIESLTTDFDGGFIEVRTNDGDVVRQRLETVPDGTPMEFKRVSWRPAELVMTMVTIWDEELEVEVFSGEDASARAGRPIVYLDQNIWVQISKAIHKPQQVIDRELQPTLQLVEHARDKQVILPLSSGHWIETGPIFGERRTQLASLMTSLSRGWIMRDPLRVTLSELCGFFRDLLGKPPEGPRFVFTLDPRELFAEPMSSHVLEGDQLPEGSAELIDTLSGLNSILGVLLEDEKTERAGMDEARRWAQIHQDYAQLAADKSQSEGERRKATLDAFIATLGHGLNDAAITSGFGLYRLATWIRERAEEDLASLPYVGLQRELIHVRLMNAQDEWNPNDLVDVLYLSCAAAYADYVVCEKKLGHYLQRVGKMRPGGARILTSVDELMTFF